MKTPATPLGSVIARSGVKQTWIAEETGIEKIRLNRICRGRLSPSDREKRLIARALRRRVVDLFPGTSDAVAS